ncbi:hypothetical protein SAMN06265364_1479 [Prevotella jejuni]|uniref:Uncharacterized protein n=1 Tax=Prevotella jejuni TaxID=1177574 RepID=A0AA94LM21_9BACT|nr:hypothetical protein SAMN06265364_1479 [Prevotella jejuni]
MTDVITYPWVVIAEAVVVEASLIVLVQTQLSERNELPAAVEVTEITIDVIVCLPDNITFIIVCLDRTADVVTDDAVMPFTNYLGCRDVTVTVVNPRDEVLNWFWSVECDLASLGNNRVWTVSLGIAPLVQDDITIPEVAIYSSVKDPLNASA